MYWTALAVGYLLGFATLPRVLLQRRESTATLAWVLGIIFVPYLGILSYWLFGSIRIRRVKRRKARSDRRHQGVVGRTALEPLEPFLKRVLEDDTGLLEPVMRLADRISSGPATVGNATTLLIDGEATFDSLEDAIRNARDHVHLEYYIFSPDPTGRRFRDLLAEKARAGVEVRLLYDHAGSFSVSSKFLAPFLAAGARAAAFLPVNPLARRVNVSLRNHRKIVVVDGQVGFTGGINIGDEYLSSGRRRKRWRDTHVRIEGPAVNRLQEVFAEDWSFATGDDLLSRRYYPEQHAVGPDLVQVLSSGPDERWEVIHDILFASIALAQKQVLITTPYFVPDRSLEVALSTAALRGVDVRLLIPRRSDHRLLDYTARSFLPDLMRAGVRVFLYGAGMMHAKTAVVDGVLSTVGSANMDVRSFRLNFETNVVVYGRPFAEKLTAVLDKDFAQARELRGESFRHTPYVERLIEGACRVLAPVL